MSNVYQPLTGNRLAELVNQKVVLEGNKAFGMMQHMMAGVLDEQFNRLPEFYLSAQESGIFEIVVYCPKAMLPTAPSDTEGVFGAHEEPRLRVSGQLRSISGPGKGGHGDHTEYYIVAENVESL